MLHANIAEIMNSKNMRIQSHIRLWKLEKRIFSSVVGQTYFFFLFCVTHHQYYQFFAITTHTLSQVYTRNAEKVHNGRLHRTRPVVSFGRSPSIYPHIHLKRTIYDSVQALIMSRLCFAALHTPFPLSVGFGAKNDKICLRK